MKKALAIMLFILIAPVTFAQLTPADLANTYQNGVVSTCLANDTIMNSVTVLRCVNNACQTITANATHTCQFGCNSKNNPNQCNPAPFQVNVMLLVIILLAVVFIIGFLMWRNER